MGSKVFPSVPLGFPIKEVRGSSFFYTFGTYLDPVEKLTIKSLLYLSITYEVLLV